MINSRRPTIRLFALILCVVVLSEFLTRVECRGGGRGGGGRGGSRGGSRSYGGSRGSRGRSSSRSRGPFGFGSRSFNWRTAAGVGAIYGFSRYRTSYHYRSHPDREPQICFNKYNHKMPNGSYYSLFVCNTNNGSDYLNHCCGEDERQYCCKYNFWKHSPGSAAGAVIGILMGILVLCLCIYCCCCKKGKKRRAQRTEEVSSYRMPESRAPAKVDSNKNFAEQPEPVAPYPTSAGYPTAPASESYPVVPPPQYSEAGYPPAQGTGYPPAQAPAYPPTGYNPEPPQGPGYPATGYPPGPPQGPGYPAYPGTGYPPQGSDVTPAGYPPYPTKS